MVILDGVVFIDIIINVRFVHQFSHALQLFPRLLDVSASSLDI